MSRYYNDVNSFDDMDDFYLEHFGVKGMKWKNHVYAIKDKLNNGANKARKKINTNSKKFKEYTGLVKNEYGLAKKDLKKISKIGKKQYSKAKNKYDKNLDRSNTQYEIGKRKLKKDAARRAIKGGRPDVENKIYQYKKDQLNEKRKKRDSASRLKYISETASVPAKTIAKYASGKIKEKNDYKEMLNTTNERKRKNKKRLKGTNLADYNKNRAANKSGFYKTTKSAAKKYYK